MKQPGPYDRRVRNNECLAQYIDRTICGQVRHSWFYLLDINISLLPYNELPAPPTHYIQGTSADLFRLFDVDKVPYWCKGLQASLKPQEDLE